MFSAAQKHDAAVLAAPVTYTLKFTELPAGAEFILISVYIMIVYGIIRGFGAAAQAGFGVGARVMQALFLPVVALSFAVAPVVGQNFGGGRGDRVRHSISNPLCLVLVGWLDLLPSLF